MNPKTDPAFPGQRDYFMSPDGTLKRAVDYGDVPQGLSQYAEIAARFHAALIPMHTSSEGPYIAALAFNQADAFFAELTKRIKS